MGNVNTEEMIYNFSFNDVVTSSLAMFTALFSLFSLIFPDTLPARHFVLEDGTRDRLLNYPDNERVDSVNLLGTNEDEQTRHGGRGAGESLDNVKTQFDFGWVPA